MKKMKKGLKIGIIAVLAVLVVGVIAVFATGGEIFQGRFSLRLFQKPIAEQYKDKPWYNLRDIMVSPIVSPVPSTVPSEVPSDVTSEGGTSQVPSQVPSVVVSPVASAVPVPRNLQKGVKLKDLPKLTSKILLDTAKTEFKKNPSKFKLSDKEKMDIIKLYEPEFVMNLEKLDTIKLDTVKMDTVKMVR